MTATPVVTRFAPSPTGFLHIGGARTALFNWLYARHTGGKMLLRIEDTDRQRSTEPAVAAILDGLKWLGLDWDGEPLSQFSRLDAHKGVVERLMESGNAYRCYCSREDLDAMREKAMAEGRPPRYDGRCRHRDPAAAHAQTSAACGGVGVGLRPSRPERAERCYAPPQRVSGQRRHRPEGMGTKQLENRRPCPGRPG